VFNRSEFEAASLTTILDEKEHQRMRFNYNNEVVLFLTIGFYSQFVYCESFDPLVTIPGLGKVRG
jgi:hypothetical protein